MNVYKSLGEIVSDYNAGVYKSTLPYPTGRFREDHVFDEDQSIKWNKDEVVRRNSEYDQKRNEYRADNNRLDKLLKDDVTYNLIYDFDLNQEQAEYTYDIAYTEKHSSMTDVFYYAVELAEYFVKMKVLER
jgi:hypothetical protein